MTSKTSTKMLAEAANAYLKSAMAGLGRKVTGPVKSSTNVQKNNVMPIVKDSVAVMKEDYDWDAININLNNCTRYLRKTALIVGGTAVAYVLVPPLLAAGAAATIGFAGSALVYTATNVAVLTGGTVAEVTSIHKISSELISKKEKRNEFIQGHN